MYTWVISPLPNTDTCSKCRRLDGRTSNTIYFELDGIQYTVPLHDHCQCHLTYTPDRPVELIRQGLAKARNTS